MRTNALPACRIRALSVLALLACLALTQGCAEYRVEMRSSDPVRETYEGDTMQAYAWGLWYSPQVLTANCDSEAINDVVVKRNYLHDLASVFTLGIWMPMEITYRCKAPAGDIGSFPEAPSPRP